MPLLFFLQCPKSETKSFKREIWLYEKIDVDKFSNMLNAIEWNELFSNVEEVDEMVTIFTEKILSIARESIPTKIVTIRGNDKHWFNSNIRKAIRIRDRLRKKSIKSKNLKS